MQTSKHGQRSALSSQQDAPIERIAILVAMSEEAAPIIQQMGMRPFDAGFDPELHVTTYRALVHDRVVFLVVNDVDPDFGVAPVGTDKATMNAMATIQRLNPDTLISAGTAGGYAERGAEIGDVYIGNNSSGYHDRRIECGDNYLAYGKGRFPCVAAPVVAQTLGLKQGRVSTGNSLSITAEDQRQLDENRADLKEMEAAAIANVARLYKKRFMAVKSITNLASINADAGAAFSKNFETAVNNLAKHLPQIIHFILGKKPSQLSAPLALVNHGFLKAPPHSVKRNDPTQHQAKL